MQTQTKTPRSKYANHWGVRYFYLPTGRWYAMRIYQTAERAVDDFIKLAEQEEIGAVRLYDNVYAGADDCVWSFDKIDRTMRVQLAVHHAAHQTA